MKKQNIFTKIKGFFSNNDLSAFDFASGGSTLPTRKIGALDAYKISAYLFSAINIRASKVGEIKFILKKNGKIIQDNEILNLLNKPNNILKTKSTFFSMVQKNLDIYGEVFILKKRDSYSLNGRIESLHILEHQKITAKFNSFGELSSITLLSNGTPTFLKVNDIIHIHNPSIDNQLKGESLISAGITQIEIINGIENYQTRIANSGGKIDGVFSFDDNLTKEQLFQVKNAYNEQYEKSRQSGVPLFLSGGAKYQSLGIKPAELEYLQTKKATLDDICIITGVPKSILSLSSGESYANAETSLSIFLGETVKPLIFSLAENFSQSLELDDSYELTAVDPTPKNNEEKRKDIENGVKNYYLTINEARELAGLDPISGKDEILTPFNLSPIDKNLKKKVKIKSVLDSASKRRAYADLQNKRLKKHLGVFSKKINVFFKEQEKRVLEKLLEFKSFKKTNQEDIFILTEENEKLGEELIGYMREILLASGKNSREITGSEYEFNETTEIQVWLENKKDVFAEQINETTFEKLKEEFEESLKLGEDRILLVERIKTTYKNIKKSRAETIARTEVHSLMQYGTHEGYRQGGIHTKIWIWSVGTKGGARDSHQLMDGEEVPIGTAFSNGLMYPSDPRGGAGEVINCQCII